LEQIPHSSNGYAYLFSFYYYSKKQKTQVQTNNKEVLYFVFGVVETWVKSKLVIVTYLSMAAFVSSTQ
jgi:hypothetical protein